MRALSRAPVGAAVLLAATLAAGSAASDGGTDGDGAVDPQTIRLVQQELQAKCYYLGPIDGLWGPASQAALEAFYATLPIEPPRRVSLRTFGEIKKTRASACETPAAPDG